MYRNKKGAYTALFPEDLSEPVSITGNDKTISISYESSGYEKTEIENHKHKNNLAKKIKKKSDEKILPELTTGEIVYDNQDNDVSITYQTLSDRVKESIILNSPEAVQDRYVYNIDADGLKAKKKKDGRVVFYDKKAKNPDFILEAPYMYDMSGEINKCDDIETELIKNENGYTLIYRPSMEWLCDEERTYPVTIDPTIRYYSSATNIKNGFVYARNAYGNYDGSTTATIDSFGIYYFDCTSFPTGNKAIISSKLYLHAENIVGNMMIQAKKLTSSWSSSSVTYATKPTASSKMIDYATVNETTETIILDLTKYVDDYYKEYNNYGVEISMLSAAGTSSCVINTLHATANAPYLVTEYADYSGDYTDISCHSVSAGKAGTFTVNDFTGKIHFEAEDIAIAGNRMPVSIKRVRSDGTGTSEGFNGMFSTNYHIKLIWEDSLDSWKLRTETGGYIYFKYDDTPNATDEQGLGYNLTLTTRYPYNVDTVQIENPEGYTYHFNTDGNLISIEDKEQSDTSSIDIEYRSVDKISQITDGAGGRYKFVYTTDNKVSEIQYIGTSGNTVIKKVTYSYNDDYKVSRSCAITYPDGSTSTVAMQYSEITKLTNDDGSGMDVSYYYNGPNLNRMVKVKQLTEYGRNRVQGDHLMYGYNTMQTTISDANGNKEVYQYDREGNITSVRNKDGRAVFPQYGGEEGQLLGFSDIRGTDIGHNLIFEYQYNGLSFARINHDDSIPVLTGQYDELQNTYDNNHEITISPNMENVSINQGDTIVFGGWLMGDLMGAGYGNESSRGVRMDIQVKDTESTVHTYDVTPNMYTDQWQYILKEITLEYNVSTITMNLRINGQANPVSVSHLEFKKISSADTDEPESTEEPETTDAPLPTPVTDSYGNILSETDERGAVTEYTYDAAGNVLSEKVTANGKYLYSSYQYYDKNMLYEETGTSGIGTRYFYNNDNTIAAHCDLPETYGTSYTYDAGGNITKLKQSYYNNGYFTENKSSSVDYTYGSDSDTAAAGGNTYTIKYNAFDDIDEIKVGDTSLVSYEYMSDSNRIPVKITYGNGQTIDYQYDDNNRLTSDGQGTYTYDKQGKLVSVTDSVNNTRLEYDNDKVKAYNTTNNGVLYEYEDAGDSLIFQKDDNSVKTSDEDYDTINGKSIRKLYYNNTEFAKETKTTDKLGRLSESDITNSSGTGLLKRVYSYKNLSGNRTTELVSGITHVYKNGSTEREQYTYNDYGSLAGVTYADGNKQSFRYDGFGELVQEDDSLQDKSIYYTYTNGNITKKEIYEYSETGEKGNLLDEIIYTYGDDEWSDLLTSYDGQSITYDSIGNPLNYMGKTLAWTRGRQLQSVTENGASINYKYDANGLRTEKQSGGITHKYAYIGGRLHYYEADGSNMYFAYSDDGTPLALVYNGVKYYYQTNLQGDVIGLINNSGTKVAEYTYDAWGNPTSSEPTSAVGRNNPLRYRGYVYDKDTGWYYLNSRYYNPEVGRFLNADGYISTGQGILGYNVFSYCLNNPINNDDYNGESAIALKHLFTGLSFGASTNCWNIIGWISIAGLAIYDIATYPWDNVVNGINGWNKSESLSLEEIVSRSVVRTKATILKQRKRYDYWQAAFIGPNLEDGTFYPIKGISKITAVSYVRAGGSVFAATKKKARDLAVSVGYTVRHHNRHRDSCSYWNHYHVYHGNKKIGGHIFYVD